MNVKYIREVWYPDDRAGAPDEEKELPDDVANLLAAEGYVEILNGGEEKEEKSDGGTDSGSN